MNSTQTASSKRRKLTLAWLAVLAVALVASILAITNQPPPATEAQRAAELKESTLCPVCDGQNVLESNAPVATAIRRQIDELVDQGRSDSEIREHLARQYGNDVNALPPNRGVAALVWVLPVAAFLVAAAGLFWLLRRGKAPFAQAATEPALPSQTQLSQATSSQASAQSAPAQPAPSQLTRSRALTKPKFRAVLMLALIGIGAIAIGVVVARSAGLARPGQTITGEIDRSARTLLFEAQNQFAAGNDSQARELVTEVLSIERHQPDALILSARLYEREGEVLSALVDLDQILESDPTHVDALTLRGWLLVRIPDETLIAEGIAELDAALAQMPDRFDPWVFRGYVARVIEEDLPLAIELYEAALQRNPPPAMTEQLTGLITEMRSQIRS